MRSEIVEITPGLAEDMLGKNRNNRNVRVGKVRQFARDMKAGRWSVTHQGIGFGETGRLLDGQHRLLAIIEADVPVTMMVTWDIPETGQVQIDTGTMRSISDLAKFNDDSGGKGWVNPRTAAVARRMMRGLSATASAASVPEVMDFMHQHEEAIRFADSLFSSNYRGIGQSGVVAVVARAWYTADHDDLRAFAKALTDRVVPEGVDFSSVSLLLKYLAKESEYQRLRGQAPQHEVLAKTEGALRAFLQRRPMQRLQAVEVEAFPLPGEPVTEPAQRLRSALAST